MSIIARAEAGKKRESADDADGVSGRVPYEYRRLTAQEREVVLRQREARGHPRHAPPHPWQAAGRYLLTAANFEHKPLMASPDRRTEFEAELLERLCANQVQVVAWVVLPNHYHVVVETDSLLQVSAALKQLHGRTARVWNLADGMTGQRRVWYHFADRGIRDEAHNLRVLNYVHFNPAKHGYVDDPYEWPWTSLHNYLAAYGREWLREHWRRNPPGDFGKGWDD